MNGRATGMIISWSKERGFGFIRRPDAADLFAHIVDWCSTELPRVGATVSFDEAIGRDGKPRAKAVMIA
jgi:cold shock CspA family protein